MKGNVKGIEIVTEGIDMISTERRFQVQREVNNGFPICHLTISDKKRNNKKDTQSVIQSELNVLTNRFIKGKFTILEEAEIVAEYVEILEKNGMRAKPGQNQHSQKRGPAPGAVPKKTLLTTSDIAVQFRISERKLNQLLKINKGLSPSIRLKLKGSPIESKTKSLIDIASLNYDNQRQVISIYFKNGTKRNIESIINSNSKKVQSDLYNKNVKSSEDCINEIHEVINSNKKDLSLGFPELEKSYFFGGYPGGTLTIFLGKSKVGKTNLVIFMIFFIISKLNEKVLFLSMEENFISVFSKLAQVSLEIGPKFFRELIKTPHGKKMFEDFYENFGYKKKLINVFNRISIHELDKMVKELKPKAVFIDHLHLFNERINEKSIQRLSDIVKKHPETVFVSLVQISRGDSGRKAYDGSVCPSMSAGRGFSKIEEVASCIVGLYRPEMNIRDANAEPQTLYMRNIQGRFQYHSHEQAYKFNPFTGRLYHMDLAKSGKIKIPDGENGEPNPFFNCALPFDVYNELLSRIYSKRNKKVNILDLNNETLTEWEDNGNEFLLP